MESYQISVCEDCINVIANGDYSGLDYHYGDDSEAVAERIDKGMSGHDGNIVPEISNDSFENEFDSRPCECCGNSLAGKRYLCSVLKF